MPYAIKKQLSNKRIILGVTGGIAAYKAAELLRRLQDQGADIRVVMTRAATEFITPLTMQALSGHPVHVKILDMETESAMGHIELARWADTILIAPASADFIARYRSGQADDLLTTLCLAALCPIVIAPAMNQAMWGNDQTQSNIRYLQASEVHLFGPEEGLQACGDLGQGRLLDVGAIVEQTIALFPSSKLAGSRVLITAGPTREAIDPVRYISNHSSGKQGYALAEAALEAGAEVVLVTGPTNLTPPERAKTIDVVSADDMFSAVMVEIESSDIFIGVAAVADFKPMIAAGQKIKKTTVSSNKLSNQTMIIELVENPDIIAAVAKINPKPYTVGFAAETQDLAKYAKSKLEKKNLDMIIANDVSNSVIGFNSDDNATTIMWRDGQFTLPTMTKHAVANRIIDLIAEKTRLLVN